MTDNPLAWPVLRTYSTEELPRIALPLGGIGTGTIGLGGRGDLRDWEITNRPGKGFAPDNAFFALHVRPRSGSPVTRALEGPLDPSEYEGPHGSPARNHGLPRFRDARFETAYPLGQVVLSDPDCPVSVRLRAFNPLIPADAERSGIPVAVLTYALTNSSDEPVMVTVCGSLRNYVGTDASGGEIVNNVNRFRSGDDIVGLEMTTERTDTDTERYGGIALATTETADVSYRTRWVEASWGNSLLDFWDDLTDDGVLSDRTGERPDPMGSLATRVEVGAGQTREVTFLLGWHFPNRRAWIQGNMPYDTFSDDIVGNHYATRYADAWDVVTRTAADLPELERDTISFVDAFCESDLPAPVAEAALFNLSTLRSQTAFRTADGRFFGWEGCNVHTGSCYGSCTHVWNYEQATAHLFGDLARSMREVEFAHATDENGLMSFRVGLPLETHARDWRYSAADGQLGCLVKLYRDWRLSGDDEMLRQLWPQAKSALEYTWLPGGWDGDRDGVMEGVQHNTMDVEYYGPNPQMQGWYLAALRATERMAAHLGEHELATECRRLYTAGAEWTDQNLFNGGYYEHQIRPVEDPDSIAVGTRHASMGARSTLEPELQLGAGCLLDQLVGQFLADVCDLGSVLEPAHIRDTYRTILENNRIRGFDAHFNPMRSYALGAESALLMCSYPNGNRPAQPFPYYAEVMTGMEYTAAAGMIYAGLVDEGVQVVADIRDRYDGRRRNPFNEAECGFHYARAMASWGLVLAITGFGYDATTGHLRLRHRPGSATFFSTGGAWGVARQAHTDAAPDVPAVEIHLLGGQLTINTVELTGAGTFTSNDGAALGPDDRLAFRLSASAD